MIGSRTPPFPAISRTNETVATCPYSDTPLSAGTCVVRLTGVSSLVSRVGHLPEHRPRGFLDVLEDLDDEEHGSQRREDILREGRDRRKLALIPHSNRDNVHAVERHQQEEK